MRLAAVIPAHDEARIIGDTVAWTAHAIAPHPVYVVADRCTDRTADVAAGAGARVYERHSGSPGKGPALAWLIETAPELAALDALLVLDADSRVRPRAATALGEALAAKAAAAAQAFVWPVFDPTSPMATLVAYTEWLSQALDDRLRARLGWPVRLRGTGMLLRVSALAGAVGHLRTRVEDAELTLLLLARRHRIVFVPSAVVDDPKAGAPERLTRQRARWLQGDLEIWRTRWQVILRTLATLHPGVWWLVASLLLKPRSLVAVIKLTLIAALVPVSHPLARAAQGLLAASIVGTVVAYALGVLFVPPTWRRPVLVALLKVPMYVLMWARALVWGLRSREAWMRARD